MTNLSTTRRWTDDSMRMALAQVFQKRANEVLNRNPGLVWAYEGMLNPDILENARKLLRQQEASQVIDDVDVSVCQNQ